ncbi:accessory Sec system protein Asp3 [Streptococcus hyointestinalis]|uniref:accessory Sec system protein Asp3 n=1 Tax=Streptococcus hyointestinalis TaxID=1337 RepID=UPI0013E0B1E9|nr:accessory Sec system protein Asp3 [Streptococcus hyointestinalis]
MTYKQIAVITLDDIHTDNVYTYGSEIHMEEGGFHFKNPLMPPSRPIFKGSSRYNYQGNRRSPELPLLTPEKPYKLEVVARTVPTNRFYLKLAFSNRQCEVIGQNFQRSDSDSFTCPKGTFTYTITLYGAGCEQVVFERFVLFEEDGICPIVIEEKVPASYAPLERPSFLQLVEPLLETNEEKKG